MDHQPARTGAGSLCVCGEFHSHEKWGLIVLQGVINAAHREREALDAAAWRDEVMTLAQHWGATAGWIASRIRAIERGDEPDMPDAMRSAPPAVPDPTVEALSEAERLIREYGDARAVESVRYANAEQTAREVATVLAAHTGAPDPVSTLEAAAQRVERAYADWDAVGDNPGQAWPLHSEGWLVQAAYADAANAVRSGIARAAAPDALRVAVEALAAEWEGWAATRSTPRIDAFRDAAGQLRALLDDPALAGRATGGEG